MTSIGLQALYILACACTVSVTATSSGLEMYSAIGKVFKPVIDTSAFEESFNKIRAQSPIQHLHHIISHTKFHEVKDKSLVVPAAANLPSSGSFACQSLPAAYDPHLFCSGVVDYPFLVPSGFAAADLDVEARDSALEFNGFINAECLTDVKRLICATHYLPCLPTAVPGDVATYQMIHNEPIPYMKPCGTLCTATTLAGTTCAGLLEVLGLAPTCSDTTLYDFLSTPLSADPTSGPVCNDLPSSASKQLVASTDEPYIGSVCAGVVDRYYVTNIVDPTLAPLLPPFILQSMTEDTLTTYVSTVPRYASSECQTSFREVFCTSLLPHPHPVDELAYLFGTVHIPSFPRYDTCARYVDSCAGLIEIAPAFSLDCNGTVSGMDYSVYPTDPQTILSVSTGFSVTKLTSPPREVDQNEVATVVPQCPYGTQIPEEPFPPSSQMIWLGDFACAMSCPSPIYTDREYSWLYSAYRVAQWLCIGLSLPQIVNIYAMKARRRSKYLVVGVCLIFAQSLLLLVQQSRAQQSRNMVCESSTSWRSQQDAWADADSARCVVSAYATTYLGYASAAFMVPLSAEVWLRAVHGVKNTKAWEWYYLWPSLASCVVFGFLGSVYGQADVTVPGAAGLACQLTHDNRYVRFLVTTLPYMLYFCVSLALSLHSMYVLWVVSRRISGVRRLAFAQHLSTFHMVLFVLVLFQAAYAVAIFYFMTMVGFGDQPSYVEGMNDWLLCLFSNFKGADDLAYIATCGTHPSVRPSMGLQYAGICLLCPVSGAYFWITLNGEAKALWRSIAIGALHKSPLLAVIRSLLRVRPHAVAAANDMAIDLSKQRSTPNESVCDDEESAHNPPTMHDVRVKGKQQDSSWFDWFSKLSRLMQGRKAAYEVVIKVHPEYMGKFKIKRTKPVKAGYQMVMLGSSPRPVATSFSWQHRDAYSPTERTRKAKQHGGKRRKKKNQVYAYGGGGSPNCCPGCQMGYSGCCMPGHVGEDATHGGRHGDFGGGVVASKQSNSGGSEHERRRQEGANLLKRCGVAR